MLAENAKPSADTGAMRDVFECTECGLRASMVIIGGHIKFPFHHDQMMRMLDGHELNKLLRKKVAAVGVEVDDDGVVVDPVVDEAVE